MCISLAFTSCIPQLNNGELCYLTIIELAMRVCVCVRACVCVFVCKSTPRTADVIVTKIAGYVRIRILMNQ